jgi:hypothetical protein
MKPDHKYLWKYVVGKSKIASTKKQRFKSITRGGVPQSDWVSGMTWGIPVVAIAPPVGGCYE